MNICMMTNTYLPHVGGVVLKPGEPYYDMIDSWITDGVPFDKDLEGRLLVGQEAAHSTRRIVHVRGDLGAFGRSGGRSRRGRRCRRPRRRQARARN